jgi:hypothetical protein
LTASERFDYLRSVKLIGLYIDGMEKAGREIEGDGTRKGQRRANQLKSLGGKQS